MKLYMAIIGLMCALLIPICVIIVNDEKQKEINKTQYEFETYYDKDTGLTMRIFKDGLGDVLWCEPIEAEMEVNE